MPTIEPWLHTPTLGTILLTQARHLLNLRLGLASTAPAPHPALAERGCCFVELHRNGERVASAGSFRAHGPLGEALERHLDAALADGRLGGITSDLRLEITALGAPDFIEPPSEASALAQLHVGEDAVLLFHGCRQAGFLPRMWAELPSPALLVAALKHQLGREPTDWRGMMLARLPALCCMEDMEC